MQPIQSEQLLHHCQPFRSARRQHRNQRSRCCAAKPDGVSRRDAIASGSALLGSVAMGLAISGDASAAQLAPAAPKSVSDSTSLPLVPHKEISRDLAVSQVSWNAALLPIILRNPSGARSRYRLRRQRMMSVEPSIQIVPAAANF